MKPVNQSERKKAFGNFLFFFIITIAVIVTTVFFSTRVPAKQNDYLIKQMGIVENERAFAESFKQKMQETMNLLDSVNQQPNSDYIDGKIATNIATMTQMTAADSSSMHSFYLATIQTLNNLKLAKAQIRQQLSQNANVGTGESVKDQQIKFLNDQLQACKDALAARK